MKKTVVLGFYGTTLDSAAGAKRWKRWRPTYSLTEHDDLLVDRLELLCPPKAKPQVLISDIERASPETDIVVHAFDAPDPWDFEDVYARLHDFARAYPFDVDAERYLLHLTTGTHVAQICLFLLTESGHFPGSLLQSGPARGGDNASSYQIIDLDLSRYDRLAQRFETERSERTAELRDGIASRNAPFNRLIENVESVSRMSAAPILLSGPTGAGKTHLARRIHALKLRAGLVTEGLVETNCATLRGDHAISTLFGHRRGAFTGARSDRKGILELAHQGMVFLDEIGELGLDEQAMLLSALEDKRFTPLGAEKPVHSEFQLIAGTNRDLRKSVREGTFRRDLLARIDLWHFELPPLAERREDIESNIDFELRRAGAELERRAFFGGKARARYLRFAKGAPWHGNFRDLSGSILRMATLAQGGRITEVDVDAEIARLRERWGGADSQDASNRRVRTLLGNDAESLDRFDRMQLESVLDVCARSESLADAGRRLFDQSRLRKKSQNDADRIRKYLARFGLSGRDVVGTER